MASGRGFRPSIQNPTPRTAPGTRRRGLRRVLEGCAPDCRCGPLARWRKGGAAHDAVDATRQPEGKGQPADAVEATKGQRKHA